MMKTVVNYSVFALCLLFTVTSVSAQNKIKGSRNVIEESQNLGIFSKLIVTDELEVKLLKGLPGYDLEMDDNLIREIDFDIDGDVLRIGTRAEIRSSKKLEITVRYQNLNEITLEKKAKVTLESTIESKQFKGIFRGGSEFEGEIRADSLAIQIGGNSKFEGDIKSDRFFLDMTENAFAEIDIDTDEFTLTASSRSDIELKGNVNDANINLTGSAQLKAKSLDIDKIILAGRESSEASLRADKDISIDLADKSTLFLYGDPDIVISKFSDSAKILKEN